jgi:hypothetical protein
MRHCLLVALVLTCGLTGTVWAESGDAMPRVGKSCPSGYFKSGEYCVQGSDRAKPAIERAGKSCPSGYYRSGEYCMAGSERAKAAITRQGSSCPRGYYRSGEYCVANQ